MKMKGNKLPENFLQKYRRGRPESVDYVPLTRGFLRLEYGLYGVSSQLCLVSFVLAASDDALAIGPRLEINLPDDESDGGDVTYISENGVSGIQWSGGYATWGHTYDDDSPAPKGEKIELARWMDRCIAEMINPTEEEIAERIRLDKEDQ